MMAMSPTDLGSAIGEFWPDARREWARLATLQRKIEGKLTTSWTPQNADLEYKDLLRKSSSPWLQFGRDCIAQGLRVDGYSDEQVWADAWQRSGMDGRQGPLNREVVGLGYGYIASLPAEDGGVRMVPMSALRTFAIFADPWDEHPAQVLHLLSGDLSKPKSQRWMYIDGEHIYRFSGAATTPREVTALEHELPHVTVAPIQNTLVTGGRPQSSVEPAIPVYQRIVDATFSLQMIQRYGAFPQKWMAGGELAKDENGNTLVRPSVDSLLHADGPSGETARFGTFQAASAEDAAKAVETHIRHLSAILQVPPHYLLGAIVNMSAEGIAAAEAGYFRNIDDRKDAIGEGYELALRDAALVLGFTDAAADTSSQVHWADQSARSLAQISDSVVKLATVGAPLEMLFALVPGWTKQDAIEAAAYVRSEKALENGVGEGQLDESAQMKARADALGILIRSGMDPDDAAARVGLAGAKFTGAVPVTLRQPQDQARQLEQ